MNISPERKTAIALTKLYKKYLDSFFPPVDEAAMRLSKEEYRKLIPSISPNLASLDEHQLAQMEIFLDKVTEMYKPIQEKVMLIQLDDFRERIEGFLRTNYNQEDIESLYNIVDLLNNHSFLSNKAFLDEIINSHFELKEKIVQEHTNYMNSNPSKMKEQIDVIRKILKDDIAEG